MSRTATEMRRAGCVHSLAQAALRILCAGLAAILASLIGLLGVLVIWSHPGRPRNFVDQRGAPLPRALAEKVFVEMNGARQGMIIESRDTANPVLLFLHGGMPEYFLSKRYPTGLEDLFTVVWWEQRGAGLSYTPGIARETLTSEQFIADTLAVTDYLRDRFGKDRIYLMAHSGGTFFGIQAAARAPERFYAYLGVAQMSNQVQSEWLAYNYMVAQLRDLGQTDMLRRLEAAPVSLTDGTPAAYLRVRDAAMHRLGIGTMHAMTDFVRGLFLTSLQCREYTLSEKVRLWRGKFTAGVSALWDEALEVDLSERVPSVNVPVYFLHGAHDYTVSYPLAKAYFDRLQAPIKGFYTFQDSAHSPMFEERARMLRILREDVLRSSSSLADANCAAWQATAPSNKRLAQSC
jgi:pimeloyl-ACP methyl ester carboxylesterase